VVARIKVGSRFILRLSEGILRSRLIDPVIGARPPLVVLSAPSGYGKTVLAAQIASAGAFPEAVWIDGSGERGSVSDSLARLLLSVGQGCSERLETDDLADACCAELAGWSDERCLLLVIDNASWASCPADVAVLMTAMSEAPRGSVVVMTTREPVGQTPAAWVVTAEQLRMSDAELRALWSLMSATEMTERDSALLVEISGRHPALAALTIRHWAMNGSPGVPELHPDAAHLIRSLTSSQLSQPEREVLDYAAVLGDGTADLLAECAQRHDAPALLRRVATILPLVAVSGPGAHAVFSVHQMVAEALEGAKQLGSDNPGGFERTVKVLVEAGEHRRGLDLACEHGDDVLIAWCLNRAGDALLTSGHQESVSAALGSLRAMDVASDARLLLLRAECSWARWDGAEAASGARLALRVAETCQELETVVRSRLLLARIRAIAMDYEGVVAEVEPLVAEGAPFLDDDARADALVALTLAHTFLGNRDGLRSLARHMAALDASKRLRTSSGVRVAVCRGLCRGLLDGDWPAALDCFNVSHLRGSDHSVYSDAAEIDELGAMLNVGLVEQAGLRAARILSLRGDSSEVAPSLRLVCAAASALLEPDSELCASVEAALHRDAAIGDTMAMTSGLIVASELALSVRDRDYALSLADRGIRAAMATGSPVLLSLAELAQSMALVAAGDSERGAQVARRLLPPAEALEAEGHVMRARLVLAAVAFEAGDLASSVENLSRVSDYIIQKSPALTVATYLRAIPAMLGPLALAMGIDSIPVRVLNLLPGVYGKEALEQASAVLTPAECRRLAARMRNEAHKVAERAAAADLSDAVCQVRVLGRMEVVAPHGPVADRDWCKRKARLLFAMLVVRAGTDVPRGEIIEYLWPEMDEDRALNNFYVVWSAMKRALAPNSIRETPCPFVEHVHGVCRIVPGRVTTDLDEFDAHLAAARSARERGDAEAELAALRAAERAYRGDVLPGDIYDDWFAPVRSRYRHEFEDAMLRAAQVLEERGDPHEGLSLLRRPMLHDVLREDFYQAALRLQIAAGQRSAAIETYMSCRNRLVEDLGIDPSRETTALYEQVLGMETPPLGRPQPVREQ
jgi:DNA-binding SARP family transcriptional activator